MVWRRILTWNILFIPPTEAACRNWDPPAFCTRFQHFYSLVSSLSTGNLSRYKNHWPAKKRHSLRKCPHLKGKALSPLDAASFLWCCCLVHNLPYPERILVVLAMLHEGAMHPLRQQDLGADVAMGGGLAGHRVCQGHVPQGRWRGGGCKCLCAH